MSVVICGASLLKEGEYKLRVERLPISGGLLYIVSHKDGEKEVFDYSCDVIELPPHGDLIERDALYKEIEEHWGCSAYTGLTFSLNKVTNAPTVIEAEE